MQHSFTLDGLQSLAGFEVDLNNAFQSLASTSSSPTEPVIKFPYQLWVDTSVTPPLINQRNGTNDDWVLLGTLEANFGLPSLFTSIIENALLNNPVFVTPTALSQSTGDSSDKIATTDFTVDEGNSRLRLLTVGTVNQDLAAVATWFDVDYSTVFSTPEYNSTDKIFTVETAGVYRISHSFTIIHEGGVPPTYTMGVAGYSVDGQNITASTSGSVDPYCAPSFSHFIHLNAGQVIKPRAFRENVGGSDFRSYIMAINAPTFSIERVSSD